jgi:hypothetical protein
LTCFEQPCCLTIETYVTPWYGQKKNEKYLRKILITCEKFAGHGKKRRILTALQDVGM